MSGLELFLHDKHVGDVHPARRDKTRVTLEIAPNYRPDILLTESFATLSGRQPPSDTVSNFLGGYAPEGNHRARMATKRRIDSENLFALLTEFGGSIALSKTTASTSITRKI